MPLLIAYFFFMIDTEILINFDFFLWDFLIYCFFRSHHLIIRLLESFVTFLKTFLIQIYRNLEVINVKFERV